MARYDVRYVHKVSQTCMCGCPQYGHRRPGRPPDGPAFLGDVMRDSPVWGEGACLSARCASTPVGDYDGSTPCTSFTPKSEVMEFEFPADPSDLQVLAAALKKARIMSEPIESARYIAEGRFVVFPKNSSWHSIILTPVAS